MNSLGATSLRIEMQSPFERGDAEHPEAPVERPLEQPAELPPEVKDQLAAILKSVQGNGGPIHIHIHMEPKGVENKATEQISDSVTLEEKIQYLSFKLIGLCALYHFSSESAVLGALTGALVSLSKKGKVVSRLGDDAKNFHDRSISSHVLDFIFPLIWVFVLQQYGPSFLVDGSNKIFYPAKELAIVGFAFQAGRSLINYARGA